MQLLKFSIQRIWRDTFTNLLICLLFIFPSLEIGWYIHNIWLGGTAYLPDFAFYLTCNSAGVGHIFQSIFTWFMPLYVLLLTANDCLEDNRTGYRNIMISKVGKKKYVQTHLCKSFLLVFVLVAAALLLNLLLVHIIFRDGRFSPYGAEVITSEFYRWEQNWPLLANLLFTGITAFFSGLISMVGTISAIVIKNKKIVYGITIIAWFIPFLQEKSLVLLFQPQSEYYLDTLIPLGGSVGLVYILYIVIGYCKEVCFEKKSI